jgi:hypothetical protein
LNTLTTITGKQAGFQSLGRIPTGVSLGTHKILLAQAIGLRK